MDTDTTTTPSVAEFADDEQRDAHIAALETEAKSLAAAEVQPTLTDEQRAAKARRRGDVAAELTRLRGGGETRPRRGATTR